MALYLNFLAPGALPEFNLVPGGVYEGELYFYQGVGALRALPQNMKWLDSTFLPSLCADIPVAMQSYRAVIQTHPFAEEVPLLVDNVRLVTSGNTHYLQDVGGVAVQVHIEETARVDILAITGGKPFSAFLLADAVSCELKTIWYQSEFYFWKDELN